MEDACIKVDSLMKMPLQYIVHIVIDFYGCDTMILSPDPITSEADTKNDNNPNNKKKEGINHQSLVDCLNVPGRSK